MQAEQSLRFVVSKSPSDLQSRTDLGTLLANTGTPTCRAARSPGRDPNMRSSQAAWFGTTPGVGTWGSLRTHSALELPPACHVAMRSTAFVTRSATLRCAALPKGGSTRPSGTSTTCRASSATARSMRSWALCKCGPPASLGTLARTLARTHAHLRMHTCACTGANRHTHMRSPTHALTHRRKHGRGRARTCAYTPPRDPLPNADVPAHPPLN
jgi:hypothetical protein